MIILTTGTDGAGTESNIRYKQYCIIISYIHLFALSNRRPPGMTMLASLEEKDALTNRSLIPPGNLMLA